MAPTLCHHNKLSKWKSSTSETSDNWAWLHPQEQVIYSKLQMKNHMYSCLLPSILLSYLHLSPSSFPSSSHRLNGFCSFLPSLQVNVPPIKCWLEPAASGIRLAELQNQFVQYFNVVFIPKIWKWKNKRRAEDANGNSALMTASGVQ